MTKIILLTAIGRCLITTAIIVSSKILIGQTINGIHTAILLPIHIPKTKNIRIRTQGANCTIPFVLIRMSNVLCVVELYPSYFSTFSITLLTSESPEGNM